MIETMHDLIIIKVLKSHEIFKMAAQMSTILKVLNKSYLSIFLDWFLSNEPPHDKTSKIALCPAKTRISLGICPVWSESSLCTQWVAKDPSFLHANIEDLSDWADAQADLSLRWVHSHFVGFVMRWLKFVSKFLVCKVLCYETCLGGWYKSSIRWGFIFSNNLWWGGGVLSVTSH